MGNIFLSLKLMSKLIISLLVLAVFSNVVEARHLRRLSYTDCVRNGGDFISCAASIGHRRLSYTNCVRNGGDFISCAASIGHRRLQNCGNCMTHDCNNCRTLNPGNDAACKERCGTSCQVCRGGSNESTTHDAGCTPGLPMYNMVCSYWPAK